MKSEKTQQLFGIIAGRQVTLTQLMDEGAGVTLGCDLEGMRYYMDKLVSANLVKKVQLPRQRVRLGRQFGENKPLVAYKAVGGSV